MTIDNALLVRQAIYNAPLEVIAYELLFKRNANQTTEVAGHAMTAEVILAAFADVGLDKVIGGHKGYVNFPLALLTESFILSLPKEKMVIEILEDVPVSTELVSLVSRMVQAGYEFALDDFVYRPEFDPLIELAKIIKIDVLALNREQIEAQLRSLKNFQGILLAEKVEDHDMLDFCKQRGFKYFQGYFLSRPNPVPGKKVTANQVVVLNLLTELQNPKLDIDDLEKIIAQDSKMSYKLLRIVNTVAYAITKKIGSLKEAVIYLGLDRLRSWATLLAFSMIENKPSELRERTAIRARMCANIAQRLGEKVTGPYFTVGLFSTLNALLDEEMSLLLKEIPLSEELKAALLNHEGLLGNVLRSVIAYENADWSLVDNTVLDNNAYREAYLDALEWTQGLSGVMS